MTISLLRTLTTKSRVLPPPPPHRFRLPSFPPQDQTTARPPHINCIEPRSYEPPETPHTRVLTPVGLELNKPWLGLPFNTTSRADRFKTCCADAMNTYANKLNPYEVFKQYEMMKKMELRVEGSEVAVYGGLMKALFSNQQEEEAMKRYDELMRVDESSVWMNAVAYKYVLEALLEKGKLDEAFKLFDRMKAKHNPPSTILLNLEIYNLIVRVYLNQGRPKEAVDLFMGMDEMGCSPDTTAFNNLINSLCHDGLLAEAEELCGRMAEKEVSPDAITYELLMAACFKAGRPDDAAGYFERIIDDEKMKLESRVCRRFVHELAQVGKVNDEKFKLRLANGVIEKLCDNGLLAEAEDLCGMMVEKKEVSPDEITYGLLMDACFKAGRPDDAAGYFKRIVDDENLRLSSSVYSRFVEWQVKVGKVNGDKFVGDRGYLWLVNNLIERLCDNGFLAEAEELCGWMMEDKVSPNEVTYELLMDACLKAGRGDDAVGYFRKMIDDEKLTPKLSVFKRLCHELVETCRWRSIELKDLFDLTAKKVKMDAECYESMIWAFCAVGRVDVVMNIVSDMLDDGRIELSSFMVKLIKEELIADHGKEEALQRLIEDKEEAKKRKAEVLERAKASATAAVMKRLCEVGKVDEVMKTVYDVIDDAIVELDPDVMETIKDGLWKAGRGEEELQAVIAQKKRDKEEATKREAKKIADGLLKASFKEKIDTTDDELNSYTEEMIKGQLLKKPVLKEKEMANVGAMTI